MFQWLWHLFDTSGFPPRWQCGAAWSEEPVLGWLHVLSDCATFAAYYAVPLVVTSLVMRRPDVRDRFPKVFWVFLALVFFSCGTVHLLEAGIFWWPHYRLSALFKVLTAAVSLTGVVVLTRSLPRALDLKTPEQLQAEITERRQAEARLDFERSLLHTLMNHLPDAIYFKDRSGKYLRVSQSLAEQLQLQDAADAVGKSESDLLGYDLDLESSDRRVRETGQPIIGHVEKSRWVGAEDVWLSTSRLPLRDGQQQLIGTFGISHDITPLKQSEQRLVKLAHQLALPRRADEADREPLRLTRFCLQDMITCGSDIRGMGLQDKTRSGLERHLVEYLYRRMRDDDGQPAFALVRLFQTVALQDLDAELQRLARREARHHLLRPETRCLVLRASAGLDPDWNEPSKSRSHRVIPLPSMQALEELPMIAQLIRGMGIEAERVVEGRAGLRMNEVASNVFHVASAVASPYVPAQRDFVLPHKIRSVVGFGDVLPSGELFAVICFSRVPVSRQTAALFSHLSISAKLALLATELPGKQVESQIEAVDTLLKNYEHVVCDQERLLKQAMSQVEVARDAADAANRTKSEFLANMSHEIRTPMNAIIGMTELVLEGDVPPETRDYLTTVLESGESLLNIINEILDFSKIEAGKLELLDSEIEIREELGDMVRSLAIRAHRKGIELACEIDSRVPTFVHVDIARLRQVIVNLTGNAIKFTSHGEVVVRVDATTVNEDRAALRFCVEDTGIGIPADKLGTIFEAFAQADASTTRAHGGTGLGLAISTRIVHAMGSEIQVESELGRGSRFTFVIEVKVGTGQSVSPRKRPEDLNGTAVLLVDDNKTNLHILERMVQAWNMRPIGAASAREAIGVLEKWDPSQPLPIIISDVHMPSVDGFEMVRRIQSNPAIAAAPVVFLTSGGTAAEREQSLELKAAALLLKPVKQAEVLGALLLACGQSEYSEPRRPADVKKDQPPSLAQSPLRVLLVEDGVANQKLAVGLLQRWGHTVTIANNGAIAVEFCQQQPFDLVLMDLQMPVMDGLEATRQIRQREAGTGQHLPIVAMTAHALVGDRDRCLRAGMDHYISKPIHKKDLAEVIMMFSRHDGGEGAEPVADKTPTAQTPAPPAAAPPTEIAAIDLQAALEMMENDHDILQSVVEAFVIEAPVLLEQLDQAIASGDLVTAQRSAHTLKGNFRLLQLHDHQRLWEQVEMLAKERKVELLSAPIEQARAMTRQSLLQLGRCLEEGI